MANTYTSLHYHLVFSTKNRTPWLTPDIEARVWEYIGGVARHHKMVALQIGGFDDHIHALIAAPATVSPSQMAQYLKGDSSKWIHETFPELRDFAWQEGYGAFTVNKSILDAVIGYIQKQREHHQKESFQDEHLQAVNDLPTFKHPYRAKHIAGRESARLETEVEKNLLHIGYEIQ